MMEAWSNLLELRLLGPVEIRYRGELLGRDARPQQRALLAALAVDANRPVPVDALLDRVWGSDRSESARRTMRTHLDQLRRLLEQVRATDEPAQLILDDRGYVLRINPERVDLHRFRDLVSQAEKPDATDGQRIALLQAAMGLRRGELLTGLSGNWVERTRHHWRQQHIDTVLTWASVALRVGAADAVLSVLTDLIGEFGTESGMPLRRLYEAILRGDPVAWS